MVMKPVLFYCFLVSLFANCTAQHRNEGYVKMHTLNLDKVTKEVKPLFCVDDKRLWFKDSTMVMEIIVCASEDSFDFHKAWTEISHYIFCDFKTLSFYEYLHFSDTALLRTSYKTPNDTSKQFFYPFHRETTIPKNMIDNGKWLSDSMIDGTRLGRYQFDYNSSNDKGPFTLTYILYMDCNQTMKGNFVRFFKGFSEQHNCPVVAFDRCYQNIVQGYRLVRINNALNKEQVRAFDAWEKYAKEHPVK